MTTIAQAPSVVNTWFVDPIGAAFVGGLDYDPGTDTIWIADETNVLISQYDRAGMMLYQGPPAAASTS